MPVPTWLTGSGPGRTTTQRPAELKISNGRLTLRLIPEDGYFTQRIESASTGAPLLEAGGNDLAFGQGGQTLWLAYDRVRLVDAGKSNARLRASVERSEFEISTTFELFADGSLDVTTALAPRMEVAISSLEHAYQFAPALAGPEGPGWDYLWAPQLKENGPQKLVDIVFPEAYDGPALMLEGNTIEIVNAQGLENRRYL